MSGPAVPRRSVLAAAAAAGLAGCARPAGTDVAATSPTGTATPVAPATADGDGCARAFARTSDIPLGGGTVFKDLRVIVTQPSPGEFRGFGIVCTHDGCELDRVSDGTINCPCHGSRYAVADGSVVRGPARTGLRKEKVAVDGDRVVLL